LNVTAIKCCHVDDVPIPVQCLQLRAIHTSTERLARGGVSDGVREQVPQDDIRDVIQAAQVNLPPRRAVAVCRGRHVAARHVVEIRHAIDAHGRSKS